MSQTYIKILHNSSAGSTLSWTSIYNCFFSFFFPITFDAKKINISSYQTTTLHPKSYFPFGYRCPLQLSTRAWIPISFISLSIPKLSFIKNTMPPIKCFTSFWLSRKNLVILPDRGKDVAAERSASRILWRTFTWGRKKTPDQYAWWDGEAGHFFLHAGGQTRGLKAT